MKVGIWINNDQMIYNSKHLKRTLCCQNHSGKRTFFLEGPTMNSRKRLVHLQVFEHSHIIMEDICMMEFGVMFISFSSN